MPDDEDVVVDVLADHVDGGEAAPGVAAQIRRESGGGGEGRQQKDAGGSEDGALHVQ